jgi:hypothetical protein
MTVVANGNNDVGRAPAPQKTGSPDKSSPNPASLCGAMSQQGSEFRGNVSAPQQFVHLIGCRNRKASTGPEASQYSNQVKR